jgi:hypothetical protein
VDLEIQRLKIGGFTRHVERVGREHLQFGIRRWVPELQMPGGLVNGQRHDITRLRGDPVREIHQRTALGKDVAVEDAAQIDGGKVAEALDEFHGVGRFRRRGHREETARAKRQKKTRQPSNHRPLRLVQTADKINANLAGARRGRRRHESHEGREPKGRREAAIKYCNVEI